MYELVQVSLRDYYIESPAKIVSSQETLDKYCIGFLYDVAAYFTRYGLTMNFEQYALIGSTVRSYLTWLKEAGRLQTEFVENRLLFHT